MNKCLSWVSEMGTKHNLTFSSQEILKDSILCLDGIRRQLLILKNFEEVIYFSELIDLREIKSCSLKKQYGSTYGAAFQSRKPEDSYLETIYLNFEFASNREPIDVKFFNHIENHPGEMAALEQRARDWEILLSKMMQTSLEKTA
ncbi:MAG: hypothetical protein INR73_20595 [Williamsia sp.]|nr:hypothetical protein [Williamsia sp.]